MAGELEHIRPTHPSQTNLAARTRNIIWCDAAGNNHSIKAVYWSPSNNADDLKLIWLRNQKVLVAGNTSIAIQYVPTANIAVSDIGIFTTSNDNTDAKIKVYHDSGLCVAAYDGDVRVRNSELYGLSGTKRDGVIPTTTLYAGQKYFIVYYVWGVYPAYYQGGESQTIANKLYENNTAASQMTIYDVSENAQVLKPSKYKGVMRDSTGIFVLSENDWFAWMGSTQTGMTQAQIYKRTNVGAGWNFDGIVGDPSNYHTITSNDLQAVLDKDPQSDFIWYVDQVSGMTRGDIWGKPEDWVTPVLVNLSTISDESQKTAAILVELNKASVSVVMISNGSLWYGLGNIGSSISLKTGYNSKVTSTTPLTTLPSNPQNGDMYYLDGSIGQTVGHQTGIFVYNGSYTQVHQNNFVNYFNSESLSSTLTYIGKNTDLLEAVSNTKGDETFLNANTDNKKYYLKINGNEV